MTIEIEEKLPDGTRLFGWKSEPSFTPIAPSYTHWFSEKKIFSSEECESWNKYLLRLEPVLLDKFITTKGDGGTGLGESSITSRYAHFNVLKFDFDLVPKLKESICDGICCVSLIILTGRIPCIQTLGLMYYDRGRKWMYMHILIFP